ncbi:Uncharacterized protein family UPF0079, ATPase [Desulfobulbus propionicus DSM 2032]|uniref:tRNA threonylcarbamoyladenosine biosynthesis protein TsaE n=1 Tax=Desulfobulbus propionicus (strain ATCC 33891 / DSM 2032 / VKM B-1956 / 1pr3) TaxID=577650 RepID=A0A7U3YLW1_DESPD|nr:tRNA (adenosine(37)-N6)-threonylcarbamoyltransferase complex ATPase subunit type 1 TsaE [Desulfobulbus propionicus]ADW17770.1 Uncharacterized protein family UPF0079, ATPase [Desulfobulbus propionicus DSM 2032]
MANTAQPQEEQARDHALVVFCPSVESLAPLAEILATMLHAGDVLLLHGELGAGKTTLTQWLAQALGVDESQYVASPSFALMHEYQGRLPIFHMDLYRLRDEDDVEAAGLLDCFERQGLCIVEWPDRLGTLTPDERLDILLQPADSGARRITLTPWGFDWNQRIQRIAARLAA